MHILIKIRLLLAISLVSILSGCATTVIEQLSNDKMYDIEIYKINNAFINKNNDVEICFDGRVEYKIGRHSTDRKYSFIINNNSILDSINNGSKSISVPSNNIKTGCTNINEKEFTPLKIYKLEEKHKNNLLEYIDYKININEHYKLTISEGFMRVERYFRTEDNRFNGHHEFDLELNKIKFNGFTPFKILYPMAFVLDISTLPIQVIYCLNSEDNSCGIHM